MVRITVCVLTIKHSQIYIQCARVRQSNSRDGSQAGDIIYGQGTENLTNIVDIITINLFKRCGRSGKQSACVMVKFKFKFKFITLNIALSY